MNTELQAEYVQGGARINKDRRWTLPSEWQTPSSDTVPFTSQATYTEGQEIVIRSFLRANHRGHIEMYGCADLQTPTDECFRNNPLEFVEDLLHGAPKDPNYKLRAMIAPPGEQKWSGEQKWFACHVLCTVHLIAEVSFD